MFRDAWQTGLGSWLNQLEGWRLIVARQLRRQPVLLPLIGLILAVVLAMSLLSGKILLTGRLREGYLGWNLFLALMPLFFAWGLCREVKRGDGPGIRRWRVAMWSLAWLIFFPNAPYIFTDFIHLEPHVGPRFWVNMILIGLFALTGFVAGFLSLFLVHSVVRRCFGWFPGWCFVLLMCGLSGMGVYVGRFLRWNSWDLVVNPLGLLRDGAVHFLGAWPHPLTLVFPMVFGLFMFAGYSMLHALTYLSPDRVVVGNSDSKAGKPWSHSGGTVVAR